MPGLGHEAEHAGSARPQARPMCEDCNVRHLAVCAALSEAQMPRLAAIAGNRRVETGQMLFQEGDRAEEVFTLIDGMLKLYKLMSDGRRQIVGFMVPGDFLGLAFGRTYVYSAEAVSPTQVCRFRRAPFLRLLEDCPALEKEILDRTSTELAAAQEQMLLLGRKTARERLASFLMALARRRGVKPGRALPLPMSRSDIADYLGLTIETISRTMTAFRHERLIELPGKHAVEILRPAELEQLAGS
ncbi:MAG: helix-turn-helix domain-containing protein [Geminicoccaceae bacterium]